MGKESLFNDAIIEAYIEGKADAIIAKKLKKVVIEKIQLPEVGEVDLTGEHPRFKHLLLSISAGLNVALVGPAGTGKTTAAKKIATKLEKKSEYGFGYRWMDDSEWVPLVSGGNGSGREPTGESGGASSNGYTPIKINLQPMTDKQPKIGDDIEVLCENHLWMPMKFEGFHKDKIIFSDKTGTYCKDYPWRLPKDQKEEVTLRDGKTYIVQHFNSLKIGMKVLLPKE